MKKTTSYIPNKMTVKAIKGLSPETKGLTLEFGDTKIAKTFTFEPGQFVLLSLPGYGEGTFAITSCLNDLPLIDVAVRSVGNLTQAIHRLKAGEEIFMRGPYGNSFPLNMIDGNQVILVAGGIGFAPLRSLARTIESEKYNNGQMQIFIGSRIPDLLLYKEDISNLSKNHEVIISVNEADSHWKGHIGVITDLFEKVPLDKDSVAFLCGPPAMFLPVIKKLTKLGLDKSKIFVMLERRLKCGIGKCQHCTCGDKYVCLDGPTFSWAEIENNWEALV